MADNGMEWEGKSKVRQGRQRRKWMAQKKSSPFPCIEKFSITLFYSTMYSLLLLPV